MRKTATRVRRLSFSGVLFGALVCLSTPSYAGLISIDFTAEVVNAGGLYGLRGTEVSGSIRFDLPELADLDPDPNRAEFSDGRASGTDLGFASTLTFDLFAPGAVPVRLTGASANLVLSKTAEGISLAISSRSFSTVLGAPLRNLGFEIAGTPNLFDGDAPFANSLSELEAFLLSFDASQIIRGAPNVNIVAEQGNPRGPANNFLDITSISITSVPEPGFLLALGFSLLFLRRRVN